MEDIIIEQRTEKKTVEPKKVSKNKPKVKKNKWAIFNYLAELCNKTIFVSLLLLLDFILFCRAGNVNIFDGNLWNLNFEAKYICILLIVVSFVFVFLFSFARILQNLFVAAIVFAFVWVFMSQFALYDKTSFLFETARNWLDINMAEVFLIASHWVVAGTCGIVALVFLTLAKKRKLFYLSCLIAVLIIIAIMDLYNHRNQKRDFVELYADKLITSNEQGNNFVFVAMPNLPSYRYLERISPKYPAAKNALNAMLGLYTKNGFMLYTNAYTTGRNKFENLAQTLNLTTASGLLMTPAEYEDNWNFAQISSMRPELKKTDIFDVFDKNGYARKVFEDREIELCYEGGKQSANSCVRREMMPYLPNSLNHREKTMMLLGQWIGSMDIFSPSSRFYSVLKSVGVEDVPMMGIDYAKVPAVGSVETLDVVAEDIIAGKGNRAYFVWLSLPDDGFVYDEYCQLKPVSKWIVKGGKNIEENQRINAYFEQTSCLFGKMSDFMRKLKEAEMDKNTVIVLQGVSGLDMNSLKNVDKFEANNMVSMAIKDPKHNKFTINKQFCSAPKIMKQYLFKKEKCVEQEGLRLTEELSKEIKERIEKHNVINKSSIETLGQSGEWFRNWLRANYKDMVIPIEMPALDESIINDNNLQNPPMVKNEEKPIEVKTINEVAKEIAEQEQKQIKLHTDEVNIDTNINEKNEALVSDEDNQVKQDNKDTASEEVVVVSQSNNKPDKIVIKINETINEVNDKLSKSEVIDELGDGVAKIDEELKKEENKAPLSLIDELGITPPVPPKK